MTRHRGWAILEAITPVQKPFAEVHILVPEGVEALVETAEFAPGVAADHEESAGGLLGGSGLIGVEIETAIAAVDGVAGQQAVEAERFKGQGPGGGKAAQEEAALRAAGVVEKFAALPEVKTNLCEPALYETVRAAYSAACASGVDYVELGYKNSKKLLSPTEFGAWRFCDEDQLRARCDPSPQYSLRNCPSTVNACSANFA